MKLLHTSDWHLGRALYGRQRYEEFESFLNWLINTIEDEKIDVLVVAGDIFDSNTPSNRAQEQYYQFLQKVQQTPCRHVIVIAGNHDSPSFIDAPKTLLGALSIHVVGTASPYLEDEIFVLRNQHQNPEAIICAVPYLRARDVQSSLVMSSPEQRDQLLHQAIVSHYQDVVDAAIKTAPNNEEISDRRLPLVATGHLFTTGGKTIDGDGVRDLYVGNLAHLNESTFPSQLDYVALGHLHVPQQVGGKEHIRYSGSPIPMGFNEAAQTKQVLIVSFLGNQPTIVPLAVPTFQRLEKIVGDFNHIETRIQQLIEENVSIWTEIEYTGKAPIPNLKEQIETQTDNTQLQVLRIKNQLVFNQILKRIDIQEELCDLSPSEVFCRRIEGLDLSDEDRAALTQSHNQIAQWVSEEDIKED